MGAARSEFFFQAWRQFIPVCQENYWWWEVSKSFEVVSSGTARSNIQMVSKPLSPHPTFPPPTPPPLNIASWTSRCHLEARSLNLEYHSVWQGYQIITTSLWSGGGGLGLDVDFSFHRILNEPRIVLQICERSGSVRDHSCSKCKQLTIHKQTKTNRASRILRSEIINSITKDEFNGHKTILTSYCHIDSIWDGFRIN